MTSDAGVVKELVNQRVRFPKPLHKYEGVTPFGPVSSRPFMFPAHGLIVS